MPDTFDMQNILSTIKDKLQYFSLVQEKIWSTEERF